jgi:hypothetical protein
MFALRHLPTPSPLAGYAADDEHEEQAKGEGRHDEEVDGDHFAEVSREKDAPGGRGPRRRSVHVPGDGELGDMVAEEGELRLDASAAPGGVLSGHASDQVAKLGVELRAADCDPLRLPSPIELKALAVPGEEDQ